MNRFRTRWLALLGGATLLALSTSAAFAAKPASQPPSAGTVLQVSAFVQHAVGDMDTAADENETDAWDNSCDLTATCPPDETTADTPDPTDPGDAQGDNQGDNNEDQDQSGEADADQDDSEVDGDTSENSSGDASGDAPDGGDASPE